MSEFLQQVINGLSLGAIYALIALGYTMIYGVLRFINFAHGDVFMVGAYIGFYAFPKLQPLLGDGYGTAVAVLLAAMIGCGLLGVTIERLAYRPLRSRPKLTVLITAIGISLFLEYTGQLPVVFGADYKTFPTLIPETTYTLFGGVSIGSTQILVFVVALALMAALRVVVLRTKIGTAMRAVSMNMNAASLMGININRVISFTFFLGSSLAGAGAVLYAISYPKINPLMGILPGLKAFVAAVLGGIGNIAGATLGGFLIGTAETMTAGYISPSYRDAIVFGILILILILKPSGLLGKGGAEKV
ncbi:MAG: branched-chain amino acid ABC transporter permease [Bacteroidetes bacterium]|nr:branched-chain amino acid ABC transporter permease [Bacteroidota bacterium]